MIACYLRLSLADGDLSNDNKDESNSIANQRTMLHEYVAAHPELEDEVTDYIDDGFSGTNFNRPAFQEMMDHVRKGLISTIVVKDFSRLGRNYIDVGDFLEQIFPELGVRFIAVTQGYDSINYIGKTPGLEMSLTNLVNSLYSRDLSLKIKSSRRSKWKRGIFTGSRAPYGYIIDPETKEWKIDPDAAKVVRLIFDKALQHWNTSMIANYLNEQHIQIRQRYSWDRNYLPNAGRIVVTREEELWTNNMVRSVLQKYEYTGAFVQGKASPVAIGSKTIRQHPENEQYITEDAHIPIVSKEDYAKAQNVINSKHCKFRQSKGKPSFVLAGKVRCGNCRGSIGYNAQGGYLYCLHKQKVGPQSKCDPSFYNEKRVNSIIRNAIRHNIDHMKELYPDVRYKALKEEDTFRGRLKAIKKEVGFLKADRYRQYEAYADGVIFKEDYLKRKDESLKKEQILLEEQEQIKGKMDTNRRIAEDLEGNIEFARQQDYKHQLTRDMVLSFIDKVMIYDLKHIEVVFNFQDTIREAEAVLSTESGER